MTYYWVTDCCKQETFVSRPLADIDVGPEDSCGCGKNEWSRQIPKLDSNRKGFQLEGTGWHATDYSSTKSRT